VRTKRLQFVFDHESGHYWSYCVTEKKALIPVLDFEGMTPENAWEMNYAMEFFELADVERSMVNCKSTTRVPFLVKNLHREKWGMDKLKLSPDIQMKVPAAVSKEREVIQRDHVRALFRAMKIKMKEWNLYWLRDPNLGFFVLFVVPADGKVLSGMTSAEIVSA